jgi:hypothetical protein
MFFRAKGFFFPLISPLFLLTAFMAHGMMTENFFRRNFHHPRKGFMQHPVRHPVHFRIFLIQILSESRSFKKTFSTVFRLIPVVRGALDLTQAAPSGCLFFRGE